MINYLFDGISKRDKYIYIKETKVRKSKKESNCLFKIYLFCLIFFNMNKLKLKIT